VSTYVVGYPIVEPGWKPSTNTFWSNDFETKVVASGAPTSVQIFQDVIDTITVGYADGSSTCCQQTTYLADLLPTGQNGPNGSYPCVLSTDDQGTVTCTLNDQPTQHIGSSAMKVITFIQRDFAARDFVVVQYGNCSQTIVQESDWRFTSLAWFTAGKNGGNSVLISGTTYSTPSVGAPPLSGGKPDPSHGLVWPRSTDSCGMSYINNPIYWATSGTGQDAQNNKFPAQ
jgi:hypothetical protein